MMAHSPLIKYDFVDLDKPSLFKIMICEAKIKLSEDQQEFYKIDPFIEIKYNSHAFKTTKAIVGALEPQFNQSF